MIKAYIHLTKPGIILGNVITTIAGFFLASRGCINLPLFIATLLGLSLIIASACVFNNYMDRTIDSKMARTRTRALVQGSISLKHALYYGAALGVVGTVLLLLYTNALTTIIALIGFFFYVVVYGICKRRTTYGTIIGSIAGAVPPVVGYTAVSNQIDLGALLLFSILVFWQMPHFFAIAMYRKNDYSAASIPVLPVIRGEYVTKIHMVAYIVAFIIATVLLTLYGYTGQMYLIICSLLSVIWLWLGIKGFGCSDDTRWARQMFAFSLIIITFQSVLISIDTI